MRNGQEIFFKVRNQKFSRCSEDDFVFDSTSDDEPFVDELFASDSVERFLQI